MSSSATPRSGALTRGFSFGFSGDFLSFFGTVFFLRRCALVVDRSSSSSGSSTGIQSRFSTVLVGTASGPASRGACTFSSSGIPLPYGSFSFIPSMICSLFASLEILFGRPFPRIASLPMLPRGSSASDPLRMVISSGFSFSILLNMI